MRRIDPDIPRRHALLAQRIAAWSASDASFAIAAATYVADQLHAEGMRLEDAASAALATVYVHARSDEAVLEIRKELREWAQQRGVDIRIANAIIAPRVTVACVDWYAPGEYSVVAACTDAAGGDLLECCADVLGAACAQGQVAVQFDCVTDDVRSLWNDACDTASAHNGSMLSGRIRTPGTVAACVWTPAQRWLGNTATFGESVR